MAGLVRRANSDPVLRRVPVNAPTPVVTRRDQAPIAGAPPGPTDDVPSPVGCVPFDVEVAA